MRLLKESRTFKRDIALITVVALLLTMFQVTVFAGTTVDFSLTSSFDSVVVGDTISVDINITGLPDALHASGLKSASLQLSYDPDVLKIIGSAAGSTSIVPEASANLTNSAIFDTYGFEPNSFDHNLGIENIIYAATSNGIKTTGKIFTITFEVLSLPQSGDTTVTLANKPSSSNPKDFTPTTFSPNFTAASKNIAVTVTAPAAPVITTVSQTVNTNTIVVNGTTETGTTVELFVGGISVGQATVTETAFTKSVTLNPNAANVITAKAAKTGSEASNVSNSITITHDNIPPIVTGVSNNAIYNSNVTVTITGGTATRAINGGQPASFTSGTVISAEGIYQIVATDTVGNITTVNFTIDKTTPTVTGVANSGKYNTDRIITFEVGATATLAQNGGTANSFTSGTTVSAEGIYVLTVTDATLNASTINFTIDKTAPSVSGVINNTNYNVNKTITFEAGATATLALNGGNASAFTSGATVSVEGSYVLVVTDAAGNTSTINFTINKTAPTVTGVINNGIYNVDKTITFQNGSTATLSKDGGLENAFTSGTPVSAEGSYVLAVTDAASNTSTVNFKIDKTIPAAPSIVHTLNTQNYTYTVTITYPANAADTAIKQYSVDGGTNWITYVAPVVLYETTTVKARNQDTAGNYSNVTTYTTLPAQLDPVQALVINAIALPKTSNGADNDRTELVGYLQADNVTNRGKIATILQMNQEDASAALDAYFERSTVGKTSIKAALLLDIKTFNGTGFDTIKRQINYEVTGDIGNDNGIAFIHTILYYGCETLDLGTIGKNTGTNSSQIMFEVPENTTLKGLISTFIDNSVPTITAKVSSSSGADTFTKLLNFTAGIVNSYSSEIASFKTYFSSAINGSIVEAPVAASTGNTGNTGDTGNTGTPGGSLVGTNDQQTTQNIGDTTSSVTGSLTGSANLTSEKIDEVLSDITNIATAAATLTDATKIADAANNMDTIMNNIGTAIAGNLASSGAKELLASATGLVNTQVGMIENLSGVQAVNLVKNSLASMTGVINSASEKGVSTAEAEKRMVALAVAALNQVSKVETVAQIVGGKAIVSAANVDTQALLQKADDVLVALESFKTTVGSVVANVEKKVVIDIPQTVGVNDLSAQLPTELFTKMSEKGIDKISINAGDINLNLSPNLVAGLAAADSITIESNRVEVTDDMLGDLSLEQRVLINNGTAVYDFNLELTKGNTTTKVSSFDEPITIKLKYALKVNENKDNITVLYLADDGSVKNMMGVYNEATGEVIFKTNHFSKYTVSKLTKTFTDVNVSWAKAYIESLASKGIVNGKGSLSTFKPSDMLTRAEFVKMIIGTLGLKLSDNTFGFKDAKSDAWYYKYMVTAYENNIIFGKSADIIDPNGKISREEMATIIARVLNNPNVADVNKYITFTDKAKISSWAVSSVAATVKSGIIEGKPGNTFDPKGNATRAEAAKVIYYVMNSQIK